MNLLSFRIFGAAVFFVAALLFGTAAARAQSTCDTIANAAGSQIGLDSQLYDISGVILPGVHLKTLCSLTSDQVNVRFMVEGNDGKRYSVREVFYEAEQKKALDDQIDAHTPPPAAAAAAAAKPTDPWQSSLKPEYDRLAKGQSPCIGDPKKECADFEAALKAAADGKVLAPQPLPTFAVITKRDLLQKDHDSPQFGVAFGPAPSPTPGCCLPSTTIPISYANRLTVYVNGKSYDAADLGETLYVDKTLRYIVSAKVGPDVPDLSGYDLVNASYTTKALDYSLDRSQGAQFPFCPPIDNLPLLDASLVDISFSLRCVGGAAMDEDVSLTPLVGMARLMPNIDMYVAGDLVLRGKVFDVPIVVGTVEGRVTLASLDGSAGLFYGFFTDKRYPNQRFFTYHSFEYYDAQAVSVDLTVQVKLSFMSKASAAKTFHLWSLLASHQDPVGAWYVVKVATSPKKSSNS